ncbi:hypothetical protein PCL_07469 [Purpureocillium lilacinum]|uniref:Nephrocystin 3-like N-terminal domain-containing protein n=1 Tax=Purpureocillium lilacinum TaxID=33203 RepID=A0A2U3DS25_PURLI|nr:hypothetical protein PCL_07469 [Purpureocillium lilacinum]
MEGLGIAANVIAVVDLSVKVADWCVEYCKSVKNAKDEIARFRLEVMGLRAAANGVKELLTGPSGERLKASQQLCNSIRHSESELQAVYERLRPTSAREALTRLGLRTLKWPFQGKEVEKIMQNIARCTQAINLALQVDQTYEDLAKTNDRGADIAVARNILIDLDRRAVLDRLESVIAKGASFDSRAEEHHPTCLRNTRVDLLRRVSEWSHDPSAQDVFWLNGMAGTGKSTIARTVARDLAHNHRLGASFFFKRGETDRASISKVFPTLAADLANNIPTIAPHVKDAIETCPGILRKAAHEQFDKLVWQPLSMIASDSSSPIPVVVLDALDECEDEEDIKLMFRLLSRAAKGQSARLKVFLTSRPELPIRLGFTEMEGEYQNLRLHEISQHVITHDITIFFDEELQRIRREYNSTVREERQLSGGWPDASELRTLVHMAIPLFIFAATVCRFIGDRRFGSPDKQLANVLVRASVEGSQLAATYLPVLENMVDGKTLNQREESVRAFRIIVGGIVVLASPLSVPALAQILGISKEDIEDKLDMLHSVLSIPETAEAPVRLLHLSFRDFLLDPGQRAENPFWVDEKETHQVMAAHCLRVLECLQQDMCDIKAPGTFRSAIEQHRIEASIPPAVQYASVYWVYHLRNGGAPARHCNQAMSFLERHFLHWIESLSLIGRSRESVHLVGALQLLYKDDGPKRLSEFLDDAMRFVQAYSFAIENTPLQLYSSLLVFSPKRSRVRSTFASNFPRWISPQPKVNDDWSQYLQTLEGHKYSVMSVAFSNDSTLVASGSADKTIRIWRTATGECIQTLEGHDSMVTSVAFSHDSALVASGSWDKTIRLWRTATGECIQTLEGHGSIVKSVVFSHDSALVASGSWDKTIRLWRTATGECIQTLEGHGSIVKSVVFSHDSALVASGSWDKTIRLWRTATGECIQTLEGHGSIVKSVVFSHDSALVASGSWDKTIRLWRTATGECIQTLEGHGSIVKSVVFSHDSALVASGSDDNTIRVWRTATSECSRTLEGHDSTVESVVFSHDSALVASGSNDKTIRIWRTATGKCTQTLKGHRLRVSSVAFSNDSALVASGSADNTVQIWLTATGECMQRLEGHKNMITSVAFSKDSTLVSSGSYDETIRFWRTATGECIQTLRGHDREFRSVAFSHDSALVASGSGDETIRILRTGTDESIQTLEGHDSLVKSVAFSNDSALVASGSFDQTIRIWRTATGECIQTLEGHEHVVMSVAFSNDSTLVVSRSADYTIRIWRTATSECIQTLEHDSRVESVVFSHDSVFVASGSNDKTIRIWRTATGECIQTLEGHEHVVMSVAFSHDSALVASGSWDKTIRVWRTATGERVQTSYVGFSPSRVSFRADDSYLLTDHGSVAIGRVSDWSSAEPSADVALAGDSVLSVSTDRCWVAWNGSPLLWLPKDYRPSAFAVSGSFAALGCASGSVIITGVSHDVLPDDVSVGRSQLVAP